MELPSEPTRRPVKGSARQDWSCDHTGSPSPAWGQHTPHTAHLPPALSPCSGAARGWERQEGDVLAAHAAADPRRGAGDGGRCGLCLWPWVGTGRVKAAGASEPPRQLGVRPPTYLKVAPVTGVQADAPAPGAPGRREVCFNPAGPKRGHTVSVDGQPL